MNAKIGPFELHRTSIFRGCTGVDSFWTRIDMLFQGIPENGRMAIWAVGSQAWTQFIEMFLVKGC